MKIRFKKDYKDPRPNRNKVIKAGKNLICDRSFGDAAVKEGFAVEVRAVTVKDIQEASKKN